MNRLLVFKPSIDFSFLRSEHGKAIQKKKKKVQIVRFLHDPDEFSIIADSFELYRQRLIDHGYDFINEEAFS